MFSPSTAVEAFLTESQNTCFFWQSFMIEISAQAPGVSVPISPSIFSSRAGVYVTHRTTCSRDMPSARYFDITKGRFLA